MNMRKGFYGDAAAILTQTASSAPCFSSASRHSVRLWYSCAQGSREFFSFLSCLAGMSVSMHYLRFNI